MATDEKVLRRAFNDIVNGYSKITHDKKVLYIKHFGQQDFVDVDDVYKESYKHALEVGTQTEEEALKRIVAAGQWSARDDQEIVNCKRTLQALEDNIHATYSPNKLKSLKEQEKAERQRMAAKEMEKSQMMGLTAEAFAAKRSNDHYIFASFYKDPSLTTPFYNKEDFDDFDNLELSQLVILYNEEIAFCTGAGLQKVAASSFFQTLFRLTEDIYHFYGRPIALLTNWQAELAIFGRYFKGIFEDTKGIPKDIKDDPEKLMDWVSLKRNLDKQLEKTAESGGNVGLDLNYDEMKYLGLDKQMDQTSKTLAKSGKKSFDMNELMQMQQF